MRASEGGLVTVHAGCHTCGKAWFSRNGMGLAAQHAEKHGHETWCDTFHSYKWNT